jgi:hypothetical protein
MTRISESGGAGGSGFACEATNTHKHTRQQRRPREIFFFMMTPPLPIII